MLFFSRHETCLFILATLSCNFQFVKTRVHTHTDIYIYIYIYSMIKSVRGRDLNLECFYWKLRCQSVKLQDFWYNLLKYWRKLIIRCTAYRAITQLILNNISILEFKSQENHHHCRSVFWICSLIAHIPFCHNLASFTLDDDKSNCNDFFFSFFLAYINCNDQFNGSEWTFFFSNWLSILQNKFLFQYSIYFSIFLCNLRAHVHSWQICS